MPVIASDMVFRLSGGVANTDPDASLGAKISSTDVNFGVTLNNLFDNVTDAEAVAGSVEYRCIYLLNENATDTLEATSIFIASQTPSVDTAIDIGLDPAGIGDGDTTGEAATIANETTAPAGVTFSAPADAGSALAIGDLDAGEAIGVWIRRTVTAGADAASSDPFTLRVIGTPI